MDLYRWGVEILLRINERVVRFDMSTAISSYITGLSALAIV